MVLAISASGALAPGPLSVATIALGTKGGWRSGLMVALGHMLFEFPYVVVIALCLSYVSTFLRIFWVKAILALFTSFFIVFFALLIILDVVRMKNEQVISTSTLRIGSPLIVGIVLTGLNPYFLLWWVSVGLPLIQGALSLGLGIFLGIGVMYLLHVWMDYAWLVFLAHTASRGVRYLGLRGYKALLLTLAVLLILFAIHITLKTLTGISIIPF